MLRNGDFITVCAFPYIFAFTTDSMEIRLIINGNLVQTMVLPKLTLICSKVTTLQSHYVNGILFYLLKSRSYLPIEKISLGAIYNLHNLNNEYNIELVYENHRVLHHFHSILSLLDQNIYLEIVLMSFSVDAIPQNK